MMHLEEIAREEETFCTQLPRMMTPNWFQDTFVFTPAERLLTCDGPHVEALCSAAMGSV